MIAQHHVVFEITPSRQAGPSSVGWAPRPQILLLSNGAGRDMRTGGDSLIEAGSLSSCSSS